MSDPFARDNSVPLDVSVVLLLRIALPCGHAHCRFPLKVGYEKDVNRSDAHDNSLPLFSSLSAVKSESRCLWPRKMYCSNRKVMSIQWFSAKIHINGK
jgi:hypothetical protein